MAPRWRSARLSVRTGAVVCWVAIAQPRGVMLAFVLTIVVSTVVGAVVGGLVVAAMGRRSRR